MRRAVVSAMVVVAAAFAAPELSAPVEAWDAAPARRAAPSPFWTSARRPGYRRAQQLYRQGADLIARLQQRVFSAIGQERSNEFVRALRNAFLPRARLRFELAHRLEPTDPEILFQLAIWTAAIEDVRPDGSLVREDDLAIALFHRLRAIDPDFRPDDVAGELGVLYTRLERYAEATQEYELSIGHALDENETSIAWYNLAEVTMLTGDVALAVRRYERAIELERTLGGAGELATWGLAVAHDRLGEHERALEEVDTALAAGGGTTARLKKDDVFFVPAYEIHWYEALANEAIARGTRGEARMHALERARDEIELFLSEGGDRSRWADTARINADHLRREIARASGNEVRPPRRDRAAWPDREQGRHHTDASPAP